MKKITELEVGTLVTNGEGEVAKVTECVHGNKYYAYMGCPEDVEELGEVVEVGDWDEVSVEECCG